MKKILVTGGAGFLGSHLCSRLLQENHQVFCLDNLYTGSLKNVQHLQHNSNFSFLEHDIENFLDLQIDEIYNLACPASPIHYQKNPVKTTKTSVLGILNMLELAKKYNARILHASTSEVYGDPKIHPQTESYLGNVNPIGIRSCYDEGKRCAESLCFDYFRAYGIDIKIVRIFNTYGPLMNLDDGRVVSNFIIQALQNQNITIYGKGTQTRSFCYVDDLIEGLLLLMKSEHHGPVNMGNPNEFTILELAQEIIKLTKSNSKLIFMPLPQDDPLQRKPDITLAKQILNWIPTTSLNEGLQKTISYFQKNI